MNGSAEPHKFVLGQLGARVALALLLVCSACTKEEPAPTPATQVGTAPVFKTRIDRHAQEVLVPVSFRNRRSWFLIDTGANVNVVDSSLRHELGGSLGSRYADTFGEKIVFELFRAPTAYLGHIRLLDWGPVACLDLGMLSKIAGREIAGLVGMETLRRSTLRLDFDRDELEICMPAAEAMPECGSAVALTYNSRGLPGMMVRFPGGGCEWFIVDTAMNATGALSVPLFDSMTAAASVRTSSILVSTLKDTTQGRSGRFSIQVGPFRHENLILERCNECRLGLSFLSRYVATFDFPNNRLYLRKGREFNRIDEADMSGLHLLRIDGKTVVYAVDEGSPARDAGIKAKDTILKFGAEDAGVMNMWKIRRLLKSGDGKEIKMTIRRGEKVFDVSFRLKRRL